MAKVAFTAPHAQAAEVGLSVLKEGGSAVDAMVAAAAAIAVVYPHMNSLGGDGFWIVQKPGDKPVAIDACGSSGSLATIGRYQELLAQKSLDSIPNRGGLAAITQAGTIAGWHLVRDIFGGKKSLPLSRLLGPAKDLAANGIKITESLQAASEKTFDELNGFKAFNELYLDNGKTLTAGKTLVNKNLADMIDHLTVADLGLMDFYQGDIANTIAKELDKQDSPITREDLAAFKAEALTPLTTKTSKGHLFNMVAPTQGLASLIILALYDRVYKESWSEAERVHHIVECTKQAFLIRDSFVCDRARMKKSAQEFLDSSSLDVLAKSIDSNRALEWPRPAEHGDTIWMGALDQDGTMVSFIQSIYWEFGSGLVIPDLGLVWNNRGLSFNLNKDHHNHLTPNAKPLHTLNPAFALLDDGRRFSYGTMGGEGQPQTQAALFTRHIYDGLSLEDAIAKDRWLLGRTWGDVSNNLKLEKNLADEIAGDLTKLGHEVAEVPSQIEMMGHAGGIILSENGDLQVATDPRSDGAGLWANV
ncbi:gamma-glutamyltransferase family protein [Sessilibacter sp. MAH4]